VALESLDSALRVIFRELLNVARQDGTFHCFASLVGQVQAAARYSVKACEQEHVLPANASVGKLK
jgi:hypothetical protein